MNDFYHKQNRYLKDPLYAANWDKRDINKKIKKVRSSIDYHVRYLGDYSNQLNDLENRLCEVNERLEKLKNERLETLEKEFQ
jgi:uncharacterized coiled-coil DUF342 family protein